MPGLTRAELVDIVLGRVEGDVGPREALDRLLHDCEPVFLSKERRIFNRNRFLAAVNCSCMEDWRIQALLDALPHYDPRRGELKAFLAKVIGNRIVDAGTKKRVPHVLGGIGEDAEGSRGAGREGARGPAALPVDLLAVEVREQARACLLAMDERARDLFLWTGVVGIPCKELAEIQGGGKPNTLQQAKGRAVAEFVEQWLSKTGESIEDGVDGVYEALGSKVDVDRIPDAGAREAFLSWRKDGSVPGAAGRLGIAEAEAGKRILKAVKALGLQAMVRGKRPGLEEFRAARREIEERFARESEGLGAPAGDEFLPVLRGTGSGAGDVLRRAERVVGLVRAAFGFGPDDAFCPSLGVRLQSRLRTAEEHDAACESLGIRPAALRKLLADRLDLEPGLVGRLAALLDLTPEAVRALPRRPVAAEAAALRAPAEVDGDAVLEGVLGCLRESRARPARRGRK